MPKSNPGRGSVLCDIGGVKVGVINIIGRLFLEPSNSPFDAADEEIAKLSEHTNTIFVDFHAEATSEKYAMAYYLDGRVSALWGTHTHVQTSDCCVFSGGMGYITDLGMTGPCDSIIGMKPDQPISRFLGNPPERFEQAPGPGKIEGAIFEIDADTGKCAGVEAIRIM